MHFIITILFIFFSSLNVQAIDSKASEAIVFDYTTQEVLFDKNSNKKTPPASMTKILTSYVVFDRIKNTSLSIDDKCTVSPKAYKTPGSRMFIEINDKVSINDLLKGVIIQSGNDASVALAECLSGTEEDFAKLMNIYAKELGLNNSNFINSSGLPSPDHFSTVRDLAILSNSIIRDFPDFYSYFTQKEFTYNGINQPNRNRLIDEVNGTDGLKTGFTKKSGWGIATSAVREGRRITVVINGTNSSRIRLLEAEKLTEWAFRETSAKKILKKNQIIKNVDVWLGSKPTIDLVVKDDVITTLSYEQIKSIKSEIEFENPISAPFNKGDVLGKLIIEISGKPITEVPLVANNKVSIINPLFRVFSAIKYLIFGTALDG